jgi:hypothetical protein
MVITAIHPASSRTGASIRANQKILFLMIEKASQYRL